jgi:hypothetical protein
MRLLLVLLLHVPRVVCQCPVGYFCGVGDDGKTYKVGAIYYDDSIKSGGTGVGVVVVDAFGDVVTYSHGSPVLNVTSTVNTTWLNLTATSVFVFDGPGTHAGDTTDVGDGACDCHGEGISWRSMTLPLTSLYGKEFLLGIQRASSTATWTTELLELLLGRGKSDGDDDDADITVDSTLETSRCDFRVIGYGWDEAGVGSDAIVLTVPPGQFVEVTLSGSDPGTGLSLNRGLSVDGQKCGVIFQDPLQGLPSPGLTNGQNSMVRVLPSAVPASLYCGLVDGPLLDNPHPTTETTAGDTTSQYAR